MTAGPVETWWRPFRTVGPVTVVHVDLSPRAAQEAHALTLLSRQERDRWRRFQYPGPQRRYSLCRSALRSILCRQLGCKNAELDFATSRHGKPFALVGEAPAPVSFNVSHSGQHGLIALAPRGRLGVDVEERVTHRNLELLVDSVFGQEEQAQIALARGQERIRLFFRIWTIKEALIKAHGVGFALDPSTFEAPAAMRRGVAEATCRLPDLPKVTWLVRDLGDERFAAAFAHELIPEPGPKSSAA